MIAVALGFGEVVLETKKWEIMHNPHESSKKRLLDEKLRFDSNILFLDSIPLMLLESYAYLVKASNNEYEITNALFLFLLFKFLKVSIYVIKITYNDFQNSEQTAKYRKKIAKLEIKLAKRSRSISYARDKSEAIIDVNANNNNNIDVAGGVGSFGSFGNFGSAGNFVSAGNVGSVGNLNSDKNESLSHDIIMKAVIAALAQKEFIISKKFLVFYYVFILSELYCRFGPVIVVLTKLHYLFYKNNRTSDKVEFFVIVVSIFVFLLLFEMVSFFYMIEFDVRKATDINSSIYSVEDKYDHDEEINQVIEHAVRSLHAEHGINLLSDINVANFAPHRDSSGTNEAQKKVEVKSEKQKEKEKEKETAAKDAETLMTPDIVEQTMNEIEILKQKDEKEKEKDEKHDQDKDVDAENKQDNENSKKVRFNVAANTTAKERNVELDSKIQRSFTDPVLSSWTKHEQKEKNTSKQNTKQLDINTIGNKTGYMNQFQLERYRMHQFYKSIKREFKNVDQLVMDAIAINFVANNTINDNANKDDKPDNPQNDDYNYNNDNFDNIQTRQYRSMSSPQTQSTAVSPLPLHLPGDITIGNPNGIELNVNSRSNVNNDELHAALDSALNSAFTSPSVSAVNSLGTGDIMYKSGRENVDKMETIDSMNTNSTMITMTTGLGLNTNRNMNTLDEIETQMATQDKNGGIVRLNSIKMKQFGRIACSNIVYIAAGIFSSAIYTFLLNNAGFIFDDSNQKTLITKNRYVKVHLLRVGISLIFVAEIFVCMLDDTSCADVKEIGVVLMLIVFGLLLTANLTIGYLFYYEKIQKQMFVVPTNYKTILSRSCCVIFWLFALLLVVLGVISTLAFL